MPKLRQNIVTGEWVVISPERSKRPEDYVWASALKPKTLPNECAFCLEKKDGAYQFSIKEAETDNIYIIPNKFPAFVKEDSILSEGDGFYEDSKSIGGHEVIILKKHLEDIAADGPSILEELIDAYQSRYHYYDKDPTVAYTMLIHNHGPEAGASIEHPHSQLFASAILPSYIEKELAGSKKYFDDKGECVFCAIVKKEKEVDHRVIYENDDFLVFTFFASRFPFEMWVVPKRHVASFGKISDGAKKQLAEAMNHALKKLNKALNFPPFNFWIHTLPHQMQEAADYYHWHVEIAPRVSKFGGYEMGSGVVIDVVSPEVAAEFIKKEK